MAERGWVSRKKLIKLLGEGDAGRVSEIFGGTRIYVPAPDTPGFPRLTEKLGEEIARKLCAEFGETQITLPLRLVPLDEQIIKLRREMLTPTEIALQLRCSERYVYQVLSRQ